MWTEGRAAYIKQEVNKKIFLIGLFKRRSVFTFHLGCPGRILHSYTGEHRAFPGSFVPGCLTKAGKQRSGHSQIHCGASRSL